MRFSCCKMYLLTSRFLVDDGILSVKGRESYDLANKDNHSYPGDNSQSLSRNKSHLRCLTSDLLRFYIQLFSPLYKDGVS